MRTGIAVALLATLPAPAAAAQDKPAPPRGAKTYTVEIVADDPGAKAPTIQARARGGTSPVARLRAVKPGDRITIWVRDDATGQRHAITAVVNGTVGEAAEPVTGGPITIKDAAVPMRLVSLDRGAKKIKVVDDRGLEQTFLVDEQALLSAPDVKPGDTVMLGYRFSKEGKPEAVIRLAPVERSRGTVVQVISSDSAARTLTILRPGGDVRTLAVDNMAAVSLRDLKRGETVVLELEGNKVVVITRKQ